MTYKDKNGSEWSIEKGDWIGSFDKGFNKRFLTRLSIPLLLIVILSLILLSWK
jgi:hypothetical protein